MRSAVLCVTRFPEALFASTSLDDLDQRSEMRKPVTLLSNFFRFTRVYIQVAVLQCHAIKL